MRPLAIAYGNNRQAKTWTNKTITFDELKERLKVTIRTPESAEEYAKFNKAKRDTVKDHGGFVAGALKGGRRKIDTVELRSMVALDGDRIDKAFLENYEMNAPYTSILYTTHSSTEDHPRVRLVYPLTRDVTPEEFVAVSRYLADMLGIDYFDECSYQPNQLMYWPSTPSNGVYVFKNVEKEWLDPDEILSAHPEWTDPTRLPTSSRESRANTIRTAEVKDPLAKDGTVGLFNRTYFPINRAIEKFLSDVYEPTDNENRYHYIQSSSMAGVEIIEEGKFAYSHHAKDPAYLKLCNAFDLVRIHRFGDDDSKKSFNAMCELAMEDDEVKRLATEEKLLEAETDFADSDSDWMTRLKYQPRTGLLENSVYNLNLILNNDPDFQNFAFNELANRIQIIGPLPWERPEGNSFWRDADTAQLKDKEFCDMVNMQHGDISITARLTFKSEIYQGLVESYFHGRAKNNYGIFDYHFTDLQTYKKHIKTVMNNLLCEKCQYTLKRSTTIDKVAEELITQNFFSIEYDIQYQGDNLNSMSEGKKSFVILRLLLDFSKNNYPILIDQPEDDLDNRAIYHELVQYLRDKKGVRQIILVTHNPNIVVGADAEEVIVANQNGIHNENPESKKFCYRTGALEESFNNEKQECILYQYGIREHVCEILEGGKDAFRIREQKYNLSE